MQRNFVEAAFVTDIVTPPSSTAVPISAEDLWVNWFNIAPHEDNTGTVFFGNATDQDAPVPHFMPVVGLGRDQSAQVRYNLKNVYIKTNGTDKIRLSAIRCDQG